MDLVLGFASADRCDFRSQLPELHLSGQPTCFTCSPALAFSPFPNSLTTGIHACWYPLSISKLPVRNRNAYNALLFSSRIFLLRVVFLVHTAFSCSQFMLQQFLTTKFCMCRLLEPFSPLRRSVYPQSQLTHCQHAFFLHLRSPITVAAYKI